MQVKAILLGAIAGPVVLLILALILTLGGFVPVAATHEDNAITQWWLHSTYQQSVARKASAVKVPDNLDKDTVILKGAGNYRSMCRVCHTAPGASATALSQGLNPPAPDMNTLLEHRSPAEAFVVIRDGVRMSGMATFGPTHGDRELWALVAFLKDMAGASASEYRERLEAAPSQSGDGHDHAHAGDNTPESSKAPPGHEGHEHAH